MKASRRFNQFTGVVASLSALCLVSACGGTEGGANAGGGGESVTLRFSEPVPKTHFIHQGFSAPFIEKVEADSTANNCPITIEWFGEAQLGKPADAIDDMNSGVFDLTATSPAYNVAQMPLSDAFNLPGLVADPAKTANGYFEVTRDPESEIYKHDFERNTVKPIGAFALPPYQLVTKSAVEGANAIEGRSIRSSGGVQDAVVKALGGVPVQLSANEQYEGFQRGIIDGALLNLPGVISNRIFEVSEYFTTNADVSGYVAALAISDTKWTQLSTCQQDALMAAGEHATKQFAQSHSASVKTAVADLEAKNMESVELTSQQSEQVQERLESVADEWAEGLEGRGVPAKAAIEEARSAVEGAS